MRKEVGEGALAGGVSVLAKATEGGSWLVREATDGPTLVPGMLDGSKLIERELGTLEAETRETGGSEAAVRDPAVGLSSMAAVDGAEGTVLEEQAGAEDAAAMGTFTRLSSRESKDDCSKRHTICCSYI